MYPVLFEINGASFSSYGVLLALGLLGAGWILSRELGRTGGDPGLAWELLFYAALGGFLGAKLLYMIVHNPATLRDPLVSLSAGGGLTWYGALLVGLPLVAWRLRRRNLRALPVLDCIAPALPIGYASARVGCFLVGDDYGRPTDLPWAIPFPNGLPPSTAGNLRGHFGVAVPAEIPADAVLRVHPTQLYEIALTVVVFVVLWRLRTRPAPAGYLFGMWLILAAVERIVVEVFRAKTDRLLGPFTVAQGISLVLALAGVALLVRMSRRSETPERALSHA